MSKSKEIEHGGRISCRGSKLGRTALVQCALLAQRYIRCLKQYYEKIKARRGTGKAIIALARKLPRRYCFSGVRPVRGHRGWDEEKD